MVADDYTICKTITMCMSTLVSSYKLLNTGRVMENYHSSDSVAGKIAEALVKIYLLRNSHKNPPEHLSNKIYRTPLCSTLIIRSLALNIYTNYSLLDIIQIIIRIV